MGKIPSPHIPCPEPLHNCGFPLNWQTTRDLPERCISKARLLESSLRPSTCYHHDYIIHQKYMWGHKEAPKKHHPWRHSSVLDRCKLTCFVHDFHSRTEHLWCDGKMLNQWSLPCFTTTERTCIFFPEAARGRRNPKVSSRNLLQDSDMHYLWEISTTRTKAQLHKISTW